MSSDKYLLRCTTIKNRAVGVNIKRPAKRTGGDKMSMEQLITDVKQLVTEEYGRAADKFGYTNNSDHESYAVLLEERQEADDECTGVDQALNSLWDLIKRNSSDEEKLEICKNLEARAIFAACEFIQVAAMARKAGATISDRTVFVDMTREGDPF
jgi:hypothetical protein